MNPMGKSGHGEGEGEGQGEGDSEGEVRVRGGYFTVQKGILLVVCWTPAPYPTALSGLSVPF